MPSIEVTYDRPNLQLMNAVLYHRVTLLPLPVQSPPPVRTKFCTDHSSSQPYNAKYQGHGSTEISDEEIEALETLKEMLILSPVVVL